jgi:hypothetical protein
VECNITLSFHTGTGAGSLSRKSKKKKTRRRFYRQHTWYQQYCELGRGQESRAEPSETMPINSAQGRGTGVWAVLTVSALVVPPLYAYTVTYRLSRLRVIIVTKTLSQMTTKLHKQIGQLEASSAVSWSSGISCGIAAGLRLLLPLQYIVV